MTIKYFFMASTLLVSRYCSMCREPGRQSYGAPELSSTPERVLWRAQKFRHYANDPHNHEGKKAREDVPHARNVRPILRMQIGLDRVVKRKNDDQENCAAKPRKIVVQECLRLRETLWREPVLLIRQIDQLL